MNNEKAAKPVICFNKQGKEIGHFSSVQNASQELGVARSAIKFSATNNSLIKDKFVFKYATKAPKNNISTTTQALLTPPKILFLDVETSPLTAYIWGCKTKYVNPENIITGSFLFSWAAKWIYEKEIFSDCLTPTEAKKRNDFRIVKSIYKLVNEADIIIAHNGIAFDKKVLNTRFLLHGLPPTLPYAMIDTCLIARKEFFFASNKLNYINSTLGLETKIETGGLQLWIDCMNGNDEALKKMTKYNRNDVIILEENYQRIRGYIKSHPNLAIYDEQTVCRCPNCNSDDIKMLPLRDAYYTQVNKFQTFRCKKCGNVGRLRQSAFAKKSLKRDSIMTTIAR